MKKNILLATAVVISCTSFAQDLTSKKGENYLPESGDYSISIDATPLLSYVQGIFGDNGSSSDGSWSFLNANNTITGKYFMEDNFAYRAGINVGYSSISSRAYTASVVTAGEQVIDEERITAGLFLLTGGVEWRKGSTRLQGFYGGELGLGFGGGSRSQYSYGNEYSFQTLQTQTHAVTGVADILETRQRGGLTLMLRGFIGAEYFILPKFAIGGEFGWGLGLLTQGENTATVKAVNSAGTDLEDRVVKVSPGASIFTLGTDNTNPLFGPAGSLRISLYF